MIIKLACLAALAFGTLAMLLSGGEPPPWLLRLEVLIFSLAALAFGFSAFSPKAPAWLFSTPVRGTVCVCLGVGAMFVPANFILSAMLIGIGTRLVMSDFEPVAAWAKPANAIGQEAGGLARRENGAVSPRR